MNALGKKGEETAVRFLEKLGYRILEKNYRTPFGEIDIIAKENDTIIYVEVKTRADKSFGYPFESVTRSKREKIRRVALAFMKRLKKEYPARFDVLSITVEDGKERIEHIKDAFEV